MSEFKFAMLTNLIIWATALVCAAVCVVTDHPWWAVAFFIVAVVGGYNVNIRKEDDN